MKIVILILILVFCRSGNSWAWNEWLDTNSIKEEINRFHKNPKKFMNKTPQKWGRVNANKFKSLKQKQAARGCRQNIMERMIKKSTYQDNDFVGNLVDSEIIHYNIEDLDEMNLKEASLDVKPWTDYYWPIYQGMISNRYMDMQTHGKDWSEHFEYYQQHSTKSYLDKSLGDLLSPAEKYDLLYDEDKMPLSNLMWLEGKAYYDTYGEIETWMGICHGWAPASYMLPHVRKKVTLPSADKTYQITFYPSDIRALGSLLWAKSRFKTKFVGGRCNEKNPTQDENGRITDPNCFDSNPATWHLSLIHQIGISRRSFIMDATFDYEVWNQPVVSYEFRYFNPLTKAPVEKLEQAIIPINKYKEDKFKKYRDPKTQYVVGVVMAVVYVVEMNPDHKLASETVTTVARYMYDLELNEKKDIIGGEWYTNRHPDFLWTPTEDAIAQTYGDQLLGGETWDGSTPLSIKMKNAAVFNAHEGAPLRKIVNVLFKLAQ